MPSHLFSRPVKTIVRFLLLPTFLGFLAGGTAALLILRYTSFTSLPEISRIPTKSQRALPTAAADPGAALNNLILFFRAQPQTDYLVSSGAADVGFALTSDGLAATLIAPSTQKMKAVTFGKTVHDVQVLDTKDKAALSLNGADLRFVKLTDARLKVVPFANVEQLNVGETIMAFDKTGKLKFSYATSAGQHDPIKDYVESSEELATFSTIDRDVAENSIVYNMAGELVGITLAEGRIMPAELIKTALARYARTGTMKKIYLGINFMDLNQMIPAKPNLQKTGLLLKDGQKDKAVIKGSPAEKAGLRAGDVLIAMEGASLNSSPPFQILLQRYQPGSAIEFTILRNGREERVRVALTEK